MDVINQLLDLVSRYISISKSTTLTDRAKYSQLRAIISEINGIYTKVLVDPTANKYIQYITNIYAIFSTVEDESDSETESTEEPLG